jgi:hypothetical protein
MVSVMAANLIARKLVVFVLALILTAGVAPMAMAGTAAASCDMAMGSMDMQASLSQDQHGMPMQEQQMPFKDMGSCCTATCAGASGLSQVGYSPVLASKPAVPGWSVQAELTGIHSRPELPPPIATL